MSAHENAPVTIRTARQDDEAILALLAARLAEFALPSWRTAGDIASADARAMIAAVGAADPDDEVLIAERDGRAVGCLHLLVTRDFFGFRHAHLSVIAITAAAEGTGAGKALLSYAESWTRARGLSVLTLNVFAANSRARRFYEQAGFAPEIVKYAKELA